MIDIQQLIEIDKRWLLAMNGSDSLFWDGVMWMISDTKTWILSGIVLLYVIFKNNTWKNAWVILVMIALAILLADQFASTFCKPYFARFRPAQDPEMMPLVELVNGYRGGSYGFISSHAANCFAVAMLVSLLMRDCWLTLVMFLWALIPSYSRAYLGVHYPGDLICGAVSGCAIACAVYYVYLWLQKRFLGETRYVSSRYTCSGYKTEDVDKLFTAMLVTCFYVIIAAMIRVETSLF